MDMDFLDPRKQREHAIVLAVGYVLIAIAITIATIILIVMAYGFGRGKDGQVIQRGILYLSSTPSGAEVNLDGKDARVKTNTRQALVSGTYKLSLQRPGYRTWQRSVILDGSSIEHYDYPFLFPTTLKTTSLKTYSGQPGLVTQSPSQRWLLVAHPDDPTTFDVYDRDNPKNAVVTAALPSAVVSNGTTESWQVIDWASDNNHLLLKHLYDDKTEFILLNRSNPDQSINLNQTLNLAPTKLTLRSEKYDQYYVYDASSQSLKTASLDKPAPVADLEHVLDYQAYGSDMLLYASSASSGSGKVAIDLLQGGKTYNLREVPAGTTYLLNMTQYSGDWYVALGASSEDKVYVFKDPAAQLDSKLGVLVPVAILKTTAAPTYLAFSTNARFIAAESGSEFGVYDAETDQAYTYDAKTPLDAPQVHATWMDGHRLTYVSGGKLVVFDYDHQNPQTLMAANSSYAPFFTSDYKYVDVLNDPNTTGQISLTTTALRTPADL